MSAIRKAIVIKTEGRKTTKFCIVDECPICGRLGHGKEYIRRFRRKSGDIVKLEFCVNHSSEGQNSGKLGRGASRNDFHRCRIYRDPLPGEIVVKYLARPRGPPDWIKIKKRYLPMQIQHQTTLLSSRYRKRK